MPTPLIELQDLTKKFGSVRANDGVSLRVRKGSIHGIIGENGAGKSTAMKLLYGMMRPDSGKIILKGTEVQMTSPTVAIAHGIGMVHQHFMLAEPYSVLDNIILGVEPTLPISGFLPRAFQAIDREKALQKLKVISEANGLSVDWKSPVSELPVGIQQRVEILKLLYREAEILILDEPTAVLTPGEVEELFTNLRRMRDQGKTILIITHKLKEVMSLTDEITIFRQGKVVASSPTANTSEEQLAEWMVGREVNLRVTRPAKGPPGKSAIEVQNLSVEKETGENRALNGVSFSVREGEILGIAGVEGNGQSELLASLISPKDRIEEGRVLILGNDVSKWSSKKIRSLPLAFIPEDRHREGLLLKRSLVENFLLGQQQNTQWSVGKVFKILQKKKLIDTTRRALEKFDVRPRDPFLPAGGLSGGNQQKLIFAREMERNPKVLICAQPTRGVDVGAIESIHKRILDFRDQGGAVLLVSSELDEVFALSDRVIVFYGGKIVGEFSRDQLDERRVGRAMGGAV